MQRRVPALLISLFLTAVPVLANGIVKVRFESQGLFITGSSKVTGNGESYTVCSYFDAETGAYLAQAAEAGTGIDDEESLRQFCPAAAPV